MASVQAGGHFYFVNRWLHDCCHLVISSAYFVKSVNFADLNFYFYIRPFFSKAAPRLIFCFLLALIVSCGPKQPDIADYTGTDSLIAAARYVGDSIGPRERLSFLDSAIVGKQLSANDRFRIYTMRHHTYLNKLYDYRTALTYADSMLWLASNFKVTDAGDKLFTAHKQLAETQYLLEQYKTAYEHYEIARHIVDTITSSAVRSRYYYSLGMAYYKEEKYADAARFFVEAYTAAAQGNGGQILNSVYYRQEVLDDAGLAYAKAGMADSSALFFRKAVTYIQAQKTLGKETKFAWDEALAVVYGNMASLYKDAGKTDSALYYYNASLLCTDASMRNRKDRRYNQLKLANLFIEQGRYDSARRLIAQVEHSLATDSERYSKDDSLEQALRMAEVYALYNKNTGNYAEGYQCLEKFHALQQLKADRIQKIKVNSLGAGTDAASHQRQIARLTADTRIRNQRITIMALVIVLAVFSLVIIYFYMRAHKLKSEQLMEQNQKIISQSTTIQRELQKKIDTDRVNYLALLENTDDCLWSMDKDFNILAFNKVYKEFIFVASGKYPKVGEPDILRQVAPQFYNQVLEGYNAALAGNVFNSLDKGINTEGADLDFATRFNPIRNKEGEVIGISCSRKDITEYLDLTDSLMKHNEQFKNIAWLQSHALRGPLTTIMGIADILADADDKLDPDTTQLLLKGLKDKLTEMDKLVNEIVKLTY